MNHSMTKQVGSNLRNVQSSPSSVFKVRFNQQIVTSYHNTWIERIFATLVILSTRFLVMGELYQRKQKVAIENWGIDNEIRAFLFIPDELNATNLHNCQSIGKQFSTIASILHYKFNSKIHGAKSQLLVCRVVVGRVFDECGKAPSSRSSGSILKCHSEVIRNGIFSCRGACLAYPEYIINYRDNSVQVPNTQHLRGDVQQTPGRSESKMCDICMERPVRYLTIMWVRLGDMSFFLLYQFACTQ